MDFYSAIPDDPVRCPVVVQSWETLTFVHWSYDPLVIQKALPEQLTVDTFDGAAWVGLVPFRMVRVRPPGLPTVPRLTTFPETSLRTYVRGPDGGTGVWFWSLEITRLLGVWFARKAFRVPYTWAEMSMQASGDRVVAYQSRRRWPGPPGAYSRVVVEIGEPAVSDPLLAFLTNRWRAYTVDRHGDVLFAPVAHEPWPLFAG